MRSGLLVASVCLAILVPSVASAAADPSRAPIHHRHRVATRTSPLHRHGSTARQEGDKGAKHKAHVSHSHSHGTADAKLDSKREDKAHTSESRHAHETISDKPHEHKDAGHSSNDVKKPKGDEPPAELTGALPQAHKARADKHHDKDLSDGKKDKDAGESKHHDKDAVESKHHDHEKAGESKHHDKDLSDGKKDKDAGESKHHDKDAVESKHHDHEKAGESKHHDKDSVDTKEHKHHKSDDDNHASLDAHSDKHHSLKKCLAPVVHIARQGGVETQEVSLTSCDGRATSTAIEALSFLGRPLNVTRGEATMRFASDESESDLELAPSVRRIHPGLVERVQKIADQFPAKTITVISGYRPQSSGSPHSEGRAFDIQVEGVTNETLVAFCRTLQDTGCGYYPNSTFVHVDVRPQGTGPIYWIDISGPGEAPKYVKQWPAGDSQEQKLDLRSNHLPQLPEVRRTIALEGLDH